MAYELYFKKAVKKLTLKHDLVCVNSDSGRKGTSQCSYFSTKRTIYYNT